MFVIVCSLSVSLHELRITTYEIIYLRFKNKQFPIWWAQKTILLFTMHWFSRFSRNCVSNDCLNCLISHLFIPCLVFVYWYCKIIVSNDDWKILDIENIGLLGNKSITAKISLVNISKWIILIFKDWLWAINQTWDVA